MRAPSAPSAPTALGAIPARAEGPGAAASAQQAPAPALRLFVAAWPPPALRTALVRWTQGLHWPAGARVEGPERWHLTLLFLGSVAADRLDAIDARLDAAARAAPAGVRARLAPWRIERWPRGLWVLAPGAAGAGPQQRGADAPAEGPASPAAPPALGEWRDALAHSLLEAGLPCDARPLRPHLTLARGAASAALPAPPPLPAWPLASFALVASAGGRYRTLARYAFGRGRCADRASGRGKR